MAQPYPGLVPSNVSKDAKYSVVHGPDGMHVRLTYEIDRRERALLTTGEHPELVEMVNAVKEEFQGTPGGAFYINEYWDVIVPTTSGPFFAGCYEIPLRFDLDGEVISSEAPAGLRPGDLWPGPHVGIAYVLAAGGNDIYFKLKNGQRELKESLSDHEGADSAAALARRLAAVKGSDGGRIYINECGEFFAPVGGSGEFRYLGPLDEDVWFTAPDVDRP